VRKQSLPSASVKSPSTNLSTLCQRFVAKPDIQALESTEQAVQTVAAGTIIADRALRRSVRSALPNIVPALSAPAHIKFMRAFVVTSRWPPAGERQQILAIVDIHPRKQRRFYPRPRLCCAATLCDANHSGDLWSAPRECDWPSSSVSFSFGPSCSDNCAGDYRSSAACAKFQFPLGPLEASLWIRHGYAAEG
jgi:hypothetical protein